MRDAACRTSRTPSAAQGATGLSQSDCRRRLLSPNLRLSAGNRRRESPPINGKLIGPGRLRLFFEISKRSGRLPVLSGQPPDAASLSCKPPLSTTHYPPPTIHYPLPTLHYPLSTIHHPSTPTSSPSSTFPTFSAKQTCASYPRSTKGLAPSRNQLIPFSQLQRLENK